MIEEIKNNIIAIVRDAGVTGDIVLTQPPKPEMGDFAFACFGIGKEKGVNPMVAAQELAAQLDSCLSKDGNVVIVINEVQAFGPYVNFFVNPRELARVVLKAVTEDAKFGTHMIGQG